MRSIIDFRWRLAVLKLLTMFRVAFFLCLLEMPDDYTDIAEILRISHLASRIQDGRCEVSRTKRDFPVNRAPIPMAIRKARNLLGRAYELQRHLSIGRFDKKTRQMIWKIFGSECVPSGEVLQNVELCSSLRKRTRPMPSVDGRLE